MTVYVEKAEGRYSWLVRVGRGRGSVIKSRHYKKKPALSMGREVARKRQDVLKEQMTWGTWQTVGSYA